MAKQPLRKPLQIPEIINSKINIRELLKNAADSPLLAENTDAANILGIEIFETAAMNKAPSARKNNPIIVSDQTPYSLKSHRNGNRLRRRGFRSLDTRKVPPAATCLNGSQMTGIFSGKNFLEIGIVISGWSWRPETVPFHCRGIERRVESGFEVENRVRGGR